MDLSGGDLCCGYRRLFKENGTILKIGEFHFDDYTSIALNLPKTV